MANATVRSPLRIVSITGLDLLRSRGMSREHPGHLAVLVRGQANKCLAAMLRAVPSKCIATRFRPLSNSHDGRHFAAVQCCRESVEIEVGGGGAMV